MDRTERDPAKYPLGVLMRVERGPHASSMVEWFEAPQELADFLASDDFAQTTGATPAASVTLPSDRSDLASVVDALASNLPDVEFAWLGTFDDLCEGTSTEASWIRATYRNELGASDGASTIGEGDRSDFLAFLRSTAL